jgi:GNAT superfamily N-acetyltransferase
MMELLEACLVDGNVVFRYILSILDHASLASLYLLKIKFDFALLMPRTPFGRKSPTKIVWCHYWHESGQCIWRGRLISRRKTVTTAALTNDPRKDQGRIWLEEIETTRNYRHQGYAKMLIQSIAEHFGDQFSELQLIIQPFGEKPRLNKTDLENFYTKLGFRITACQNGTSIVDGSPMQRAVWSLPLSKK